MKYIFNKNFWRFHFSLLNLLSLLLASFGVLWLIVEVSAFFSDAIAQNIKPYWWVFVCLGIISSFWVMRPRLRITKLLSNRNIILEIVVEDIFTSARSFIISSNNKFITKVDTDSTQSQFIRRYYHSKANADTALHDALAARGIRPDGNGEYPIGTVVKLTPSPDTTAYLVAVARKNEHNKSYTTFEDLQKALCEMWRYFATQGDMSDLAIHLMGTGRAKLPIAREKAIKEIVESFLQACHDATFCKKLSIVVSVGDYRRNPVNLKQIEHLLDYYTDNS